MPILEGWLAWTIVGLNGALSLTIPPRSTTSDWRALRLFTPVIRCECDCANFGTYDTRNVFE